MTFPPTFNVYDQGLYRIWLRDGTVTPQGEISTLSSLEYVLNFNKTGTWVIDIATNTDVLKYAVEGAGIIVTRNNTTLFSGPIDHFEQNVKGDTDVTTLAGVTDDTIMDERIMLPCAPPFTAQAYDSRTSNVEDMIRQMFYDNTMSGGLWSSGRVDATLAREANLNRGATVSANVRFHQMSAVFYDLAEAAGNFGYKLIYTAPGVITLHFYIPRDLTSSVQFSLPLGNLKDFKLVEEMPQANAIYVGGQGDGTARTIVTGTDSGSISLWSRRIEKFVDRRDTNDSTLLNQEIDAQLSTNASKLTMGMTPMDTGSFKYQTDYDLGDKVTFIAPVGTPLQDIIRQVHVKVDATGEVVTPVIGTPGATNPSQAQQVYNDVDALKQRIRDLESRK